MARRFPFFDKERDSKGDKHLILVATNERQHKKAKELSNETVN